MTHPFFKKTSTKNFFDGVVPLKPKLYTVIVIYLNGYKKEYPCIEEPYKYIAKVVKNPKVKSAFIKE